MPATKESDLAGPDMKVVPIWGVIINFNKVQTASKESFDGMFYLSPDFHTIATTLSMYLVLSPSSTYSICYHVQIAQPSSLLGPADTYHLN